MEMQQIQSVQLHNNSVVISLEVYNDLILKAKIVEENICQIPDEYSYIGEPAPILTVDEAVISLRDRLIQSKKGRISLQFKIDEVSRLNEFLTARINTFESKEETEEAITRAKGSIHNNQWWRLGGNRTKK